MKRLTLLSAILMLFAFGCKEKDPIVPDRGRSLVHILGGMEEDSIRVTFDYFNADDVVIDNFYHHRNFPMVGYADLEAGGIPDEFGNGKLYLSLSRKPFANIAADTIMQAREFVLAKDARTTVCFVDSFGSGTYVKFDDAPGATDANNSQVRFINLASSLSTATLTTTTNAVNIGGVGFMTASPFVSMPSGWHDFELKNASGAVLQTVTFNVSPYSTFTFYVSGTNTIGLERFTH